MLRPPLKSHVATSSLRFILPLTNQNAPDAVVMSASQFRGAACFVTRTCVFVSFLLLFVLQMMISYGDCASPTRIPYELTRCIRDKGSPLSY